MDHELSGVNMQADLRDTVIKSEDFNAKDAEAQRTLRKKLMIEVKS